MFPNLHPRLTRLFPLTDSQALILTTSLVLVYALAFFFIHHYADGLATVISFLPALFFAWHFGAFAGPIAGIFTFILNVALFALVGHDVRQSHFLITNTLGSIALSLLGALMGFIGDKYRILKSQAKSQLDHSYKTDNILEQGEALVRKADKNQKRLDLELSHFKSQLGDF